MNPDTSTENQEPTPDVDPVDPIDQIADHPTNDPSPEVDNANVQEELPVEVDVREEPTNVPEGSEEVVKDISEPEQSSKRKKRELFTYERKEVKTDFSSINAYLEEIEDDKPKHEDPSFDLPSYDISIDLNNFDENDVANVVLEQRSNKLSLLIEENEEKINELLTIHVNQTNELDEVRSQYTDRERELTKQTGIKESLLIRLAKINRDLDEEKIKQKVLDSHVRTNEQEIEVLKVKNDQLVIYEKKLQEAEAKVHDCKEVLSILRNENQNRQNILKSREDTYNEERTKNHRDKQKLRRQNHRLRELAQSEVLREREKCQRAVAEIRREFKSRMRALQLQIDDYQDSIRQINREKRDLKRDVNIAKQRSSEVSSDYIEDRREKERLEAIIDQIRSERDEANEKLDKLQLTNQSLKRDAHKYTELQIRLETESQANQDKLVLFHQYDESSSDDDQS
eukprot:TRINITY_DN4007_c0_g1_i1.p1 TRINITY_DN4007_c0_g1~~TRINITY_DN4007_c0_g1_i1.p1  ORF type:complete len:455 (+),score=132.71 TRINITY_DN4007_c0_g1_i1:90-1454(+)